MEYREFRSEVSEGEGKLFGIAVPFSRETVIGDLKRGGWREEVAPGAATKSIKDGDVVFLAHHDMHMPLARMSAGNLALREDADRLHWEADPVDTSYGRDIRALAKAKVLGGTSIGFQPVKDEWRDDQGNPSDKYSGTHRVIRELKLVEISAVTNPAYKDTSIMARDELLAERETRAERSDAESEMDALVEELRAADINTAGRKALAAKGQALPDGSYPIPDKSHLHAAAVLAASKHGDYQAAKALIRRRAKELGVDVNTLPGFGKSDNEDLPETDVRDDPDGKEWAAMRKAVDQLGGDKPDVAAAIKTLRSALPDRSQEPETSTPDEEVDQALLIQMSARRHQMAAAELGL